MLSVTLFHTCCETLHRSEGEGNCKGGKNEGEWEEDSRGGWLATVSPNRGERSTPLFPTLVKAVSPAATTIFW